MECISFFLLIVVVGQDYVLTSLVDDYLPIFRANAEKETIGAPGMTCNAFFTNCLLHVSKHSLAMRLQLELPWHHFAIVDSAVGPSEAQEERLFGDEGDLGH